jgi:phosphoglycolate phosphatase
MPQRASWYGHGVPPLLVLWDVDLTLIDANGAGMRAYELAFRELFGAEPPRPTRSMAGRTDSAITLEVLTLAGVPAPETQVRRFQAALAARAPEVAAYLSERGRVLPGAAEAVAALAAKQRAGHLVQSVLTGNIPEMARVKLSAFGLTEHLDLTVGAYGDHSAVRADLVHVARRNAADRYGGDFSGRATVLVGDTPSDVEAAVLTGARAVGVATGGFSAAALAEAGAHAVLPDLVDTHQVVAAVLARDGDESGNGARGSDHGHDREAIQGG